MGRAGMHIRHLACRACRGLDMGLQPLCQYMSSLPWEHHVNKTCRHMNHNISLRLPVGMHVQLYSQTGSVCHFFWQSTHV